MEVAKKIAALENQCASEQASYDSYTINTTELACDPDITSLESGLDKNLREVGILSDGNSPNNSSVKSVLERLKKQI